jgi:rSAM/selenodomain-associated transferase 1
MTRKALLVMAKRPSPGGTKTRLTPLLAPQEAADLYACFLADVLDLARSLPGVTPVIAYAPPEPQAEAYFRKLAPDFKLVAQRGNTLGERLDAVLTTCLDEGFEQVAAMNSDSPTLPAAHLAKAFHCLDDPFTDVVLGPCEDGGYYLIGWKNRHARLVREVQMSTDQVLNDTLALAAEEHLAVSLLPSWYDVDDEGDLRRVLADLEANPNSAAHTRRFFNVNAMDC